jgi:hypothetical protein
MGAGSTCGQSPAGCCRCRIPVKILTPAVEGREERWVILVELFLEVLG